jgi:hypothetical protein
LSTQPIGSRLAFIPHPIGPERVSLARMRSQPCVKSWVSQEQLEFGLTNFGEWAVIDSLFEKLNERDMIA